MTSMTNVGSSFKMVLCRTVLKEDFLTPVTGGIMICTDEAGHFQGNLIYERSVKGEVYE